jgi:hypothetical protein
LALAPGCPPPGRIKERVAGRKGGVQLIATDHAEVAGQALVPVPRS